ncbi:MAG: apolipoprotein N-acyltransferase [Thermodesulfobacteriota bacterium]
MKIHRSAVLVLISIIGVWFGFSNPVYHLPVAVLLLPAVLTCIALESDSLLRTWKFGWLAAGLGYTASLYWIFIPVHVFGGLPWWLALPCPILIGLYLGLYPGIFSLAIFYTRHSLSCFWLGLFSGFTWACLEYLRGTLFSGLPWLNPVQAFAAWPWSIQIVNLIGATGTAGAVASISTWLVLGAYKREKLPFIWATCLVAIILGYGAMEFNPRTSGHHKLNVSLIQANISQDKKWKPGFKNATVEKHLDLSKREIKEHAPDLLIWPETAMPFYIQQKDPLTEKILNFAKKNDIHLLTGAPGFEFTTGGDDYHLFNRAYLINNQGRIYDHYGKQHLVPFGEYVPADRYIPFLQTLVVGGKSFSSGRQSSPIELNDLDLGVLICYEVIFSGLVQKRVSEGSDILVNISNDAWFGDTAAPKQHLNQAVLRAVEQQRYLLRGTNTGISSFIDPRGRVLQKSDLFTTQSLFSNKIYSIRETTFFHRHYLFLHLFYFLACIGLFLVGLYYNRSDARSHEPTE